MYTGLESKENNNLEETYLIKCYITRKIKKMLHNEKNDITMNKIT